jgi:uncharacterized membrane protein
MKIVKAIAAFLKNNMYASYKSTVLGAVIIFCILKFDWPINDWFGFAVLILGCALLLGKDKWIDVVLRKLGSSKNDVSESEDEIPVNSEKEDKNGV